ncbi:unnamed protein product [Psylliodes chrysocephalus]|uniref:Uncharacterized protein n=1 Tax=Psylliodes chrysocephalus TaxID=3402493 RepID=A0A9P0D481_9CUCU|nr:unnamed protein product [Psylliodes chrysocephala]
MRVLILFTAIVLSVCGFQEHEHWQSFKLKHNKTYNIVEEKLRFQIFKDNLKKIEEHNVRYEDGEVRYYLGVNQFADMTDEEFSDMLQLQVSNKPKIMANVQEFSKDLKVPDSINWLEKGAVLPIRDQGDCGSCWAFSSVATIEGQNAIKNNVSIVLSPKQLVDCSNSYGNGGCNGGNQFLAYTYIANFGIQSESSYPYSTEKTECKYSADDVATQISGYRRIQENEEDLKAAVGTIGPISVTILADTLKLYAGGIYDDAEACSGIYVNHGVVVIGYGTEEGIDYWLIKNSWGTSWGESGYLRLHRNYSVCGILLQMTYPVL